MSATMTSNKTPQITHSDPNDDGWDDPEDLATLDEEPVEGEVEEPAENVVDESSNQLSLNIGGPKPQESVFKIGGWQRSFGSTQQWQRGDVIEATVRLRIMDLNVKGKGKRERVIREHVAVIETVEFG